MPTATTTILMAGEATVQEAAMQEAAAPGGMAKPTAATPVATSTATAVTAATAELLATTIVTVALAEAQEATALAEATAQGAADTELEDVLTAPYLGLEYDADGNSNQARIVRMATAKQQFGRFVPILMVEEISIKQNLRLCSGGVISVLSSGHDT